MPTLRPGGSMRQVIGRKLLEGAAATGRALGVPRRNLSNMLPGFKG